MIQNANYKTYLRGSILIRKNDKPNYLFFITKGIISKKLYDNIIKRYYPNEYIDLAHINTPYLYDYVCETNVNVKIIEIKNIKYDFLYNKLIEEYIRLEYTNIILSQPSPLSKLSMFIYLKYQELNTLSFSIPYNRTDLSAYLSIDKLELKDAINHLNIKNIVISKGYLFNIINLNILITLLNNKP